MWHKMSPIMARTVTICFKQGLGPRNPSLICKKLDLGKKEGPWLLFI